MSITILVMITPPPRFTLAVAPSGSFLVGNRRPVQAHTTLDKAGFDLTQIDIGITHSSFVPGSVNAAVVQLVTDINGLPGAVVDSWVLSDLPEVGTTTLQASQQITGIVGDRLSGGAQYWLVGTGLSNWMAWAFPAPEVAGAFATSPDGGTTWILSPRGRQGGFDVLGTPVPIAQVAEPASWALLALGLAAMSTVRRRPAKAQDCEWRGQFSRTGHATR